MKSFEERLKEQLSQLDQSPYNDTFEDGAYWSERQQEKWFLSTWIGGIIGGVVLTFIGLFLYNVITSTPETCTCRFAQHRVHFGDQYTKVNRKCWQNGYGHVVVGDTVYIDVKWFTNECE